MKHLGPLALFAALAIAWRWPQSLHLGNAIPGDPGDNYSFLWNLWWMRHVLATPGLEYFSHRLPVPSSSATLFSRVGHHRVGRFGCWGD